MPEWHTVIWIVSVHQIQYSDGDVEDLDLKRVLGGIFSGYTSLTHYRCEHHTVYFLIT